MMQDLGPVSNGLTQTKMPFFVTFGQIFREKKHPTFADAHPDGWVKIMAEDKDAAVRKAEELFGSHWAMIYSDIDPEWYPLGELARFET